VTKAYNVARPLVEKLKELIRAKTNFKIPIPSLDRAAAIIASRKHQRDPPKDVLAKVLCVDIHAKKKLAFASSARAR